jgi:integrase
LATLLPANKAQVRSLPRLKVIEASWQCHPSTRELTALQLGDLKLGERSGQVTERQAVGTGALWVSQRGEALTPNAIWRVVTKYTQLARVTVSPHGLRHTLTPS